VIRPFLHFTVGLTGVVDESTDVAHAIAVNDNTTIQMHTVMMTFVGILLSHTTSELLLTDHLTHVLRYELTYKWTCRDTATCCVNYKLSLDVYTNPNQIISLTYVFHYKPTQWTSLDMAQCCVNRKLSPDV